MQKQIVREAIENYMINNLNKRIGFKTIVFEINSKLTPRVRCRPRQIGHMIGEVSKKTNIEIERYHNPRSHRFYIPDL